jgi:hypothetical protein
VKLYRGIYESYKDQDLPPKDELEAKMRELGVPPKQAKKARQVFDRSAEQAGFFQDGRTRLIAPILARPLSPPAGQVQPPLPPPTGRGNALWILNGISIGLPEPGTNWPMSDRVKWLQAAAQIFAVAYQGEDAVIDMTIRATKRPGSAD